MSQEKPKKPRRPRSKRINVNNKEQWETLLTEVHKDQVPIGVLLYLTVNLKDGTSVDIDVVELLNEGADPDVVERAINDKLTELDYIISDVDFHISVDKVAHVVQPFTDDLLKNL
jgi:hypothetical protein